MGDRLMDKVTVVTGAGSGIGRATALLFAREGARVVVADLRVDAARETTDQIVGAGGRAVPVAVDVRSEDQVANLAEATRREYGRVDVVSCNAGLAAYPTSIESADLDEFDRIYAVNVRGVWLTVRAFAPLLKQAGGGSVIITGSIMGARARPGQSTYASSKAAANHLARSFALDLAPHEIRVNAVAPVATDTAMLPAFLGPDHPEEARQRFIDSIPLGRLAQPEDIARANLFLASDESSFITGIVLPVDGGRGV